MCSWCWGFSPVIGRIKQTFGEQIKISLNLGGLRPGTTDPISDQLREEILHHWHEVHRLTGQPFQFENALPEGFIYDTEPPSRAVLSFAKLQPENTLAYFSAIQSAFYTQGRDVTQPEMLTKLAEGFSIDPAAFQALFISDELRALTLEHFQRSRQAGVQGFPTVIWQHNKQIETLCRGYRPWEDMVAMISQRLM
jgi:putative protein-disulfide isomerase